jgi:hypothetical protein
MGSALGYVLTAGAISAANEAVFVPIETGKSITDSFNWRIVPATALLAISLEGLDRLAPGFGKSLAVLTVIAALVLPMGNAGSPLENAAKLVGK